jgi:hypothetical protein
MVFALNRLQNRQEIALQAGKISVQNLQHFTLAAEQGLAGI